MTIHISYEEHIAYLNALKTRQATPASSAAFGKIPHHTRQVEDAIGEP